MSPSPFSLYTCPHCRGSLALEKGVRLVCRACHAAYPIVDGIPDFIMDDLSANPHMVLRWARVFDWLGLLAGMMSGISGLILDVACGPGTLGRRLAAGQREFYGVDMSWGMLRQGAVLATKERKNGVDDNNATAKSKCRFALSRSVCILPFKLLISCRFSGVSASELRNDHHSWANSLLGSRSFATRMHRAIASG